MNDTGTLAHSYGADGAGSIVLTAAGAPAGFTYTLSDGGKTLTIRQVSTGFDVLKVQLGNTTEGSYTVTQLHAIDHAAGGDENNLTFTVDYTTTDHDGDTAAGTLSINVDDDTPTTTSNLTVQLDDDALPAAIPTAPATIRIPSTPPARWRTATAPTAPAPRCCSPPAHLLASPIR